MYDESVLANDGIWDDCGKQEEYLKCLSNIARSVKKINKLNARNNQYFAYI